MSTVLTRACHVFGCQVVSKEQLPEQEVLVYEELIFYEREFVGDFRKYFAG
jgi:hypothetical protein